MSSVPDQRRPNHDDLTHPQWEVACEVGENGDLVHRGALHVHADPHGAVIVSRVRADSWDGDEQTTYPHEVWIERIGEGRRREHYGPDEVEAVAALAEVQGDAGGCALAALLRDLGRDDA